MRGHRVTSPDENEALRILRAESDIKRVLIAYAYTVDSRHWPDLGLVFTESARAVYGSDPAFQFTCEGIGEIADMCRANLDGCGPTQHLITNFRIDIDGGTARSVCSVQAGHFGQGEASHKRYEMWGEYRDHWREETNGWRITERVLHVVHEFGDRDQVLGP